MSLKPSGEPLDFEIVKEDWSVYLLSDETRLRIRIILVKAFRTNEYNDKGEPVYVTGSQNIYVSDAPAKNQQDPTIPQPTPEVINNSGKTELEFHPLNEAWNQYKLSDGTVIRIKLVPVSVERTPFFAVDRNPIYFVNAQPLTRAIVPAQLKKTKA